MYLKPSSLDGSIKRRFTDQNWSNLSLTRPSHSWLWSFFCILDTTCPRCFKTSASLRHDMKCDSTISLQMKTKYQKKYEYLPEIEWSYLFGHRNKISSGNLLKWIVMHHGNSSSRFDNSYRTPKIRQLIQFQHFSNENEYSKDDKKIFILNLHTNWKVPFQWKTIRIEPYFTFLCIIWNEPTEVFFYLNQIIDTIKASCDK